MRSINLNDVEISLTLEDELIVCNPEDNDMSRKITLGELARAMDCLGVLDDFMREAKQYEKPKHWDD